MTTKEFIEIMDSGELIPIADGFFLEVVDFFIPIFDEILIVDVNTALSKDAEQKPEVVNEEAPEKHGPEDVAGDRQD